MRSALIALRGVVILGAACREPTSIIVDITTDLPCTHVHAVSVTASSTNVAAESASPLANAKCK